MIRAMLPNDKEGVMEMMRTFYASDAVFTNGSDEIFSNDIEACVSNNPYLEGYVFEDGGLVQGYGMVAKSFSTEFGKPCMWVEDIYILPEHRGKKLGDRFLTYLEERYPECILRLEVEEENLPAVSLYRKHGFTVLPYVEMKR